MKKRNILITTALAGVLSLGACGKTELKPLAEPVEVELGGSLDENVTSYAALDEKAAKEATLDLSAVDTNKTGTYPASVTYKEQTATFEVVVKDTTAPEVTLKEKVTAVDTNKTGTYPASVTYKEQTATCEVVVKDTTAPEVTLKEKVTVAAGIPLHAKDVIAEVTELSGEATAAFDQAEPKVTEQPEGTECLESTEQPENTEALVPETEIVTEPETEEPAETFVVGDVTCTDDTVLFATVGSYDVLMTVADGSGNETEVKVSVIVGEAPEFSGIEDLTVTVGTESVDYLDGVTATDYKGADITDRIVCDAAAVKLDTVGTYEILYTVADEEGFGAEDGVTATDYKGADITDRIVCDAAAVKLDTVGTYEILYTVADEEGFGAEGKASVTVAEKKATTGSGKKTTEKNTASTGNTGNTGNTNKPSGNTASTGNNGNATGGNTSNTGNAGNGGNNGGATNPPAGNAGNGGNNGGTTTPPAGNPGGNGNNGNTNPPAGNTGGNTGNGGGTDNSGNVDAGNTGGTTTPPAGNAGDSGNNGGETIPPAGSVTDPNTGMSVPGDVVIEDWGNMQGGSDDGTGLDGSSNWH